jgi:hypothetical protein
MGDRNASEGLGNGCSLERESRRKSEKGECQEGLFHDRQKLALKKPTFYEDASGALSAPLSHA